MSQLIQRLDRELAMESARHVRAELYARKAGALARAGRSDEASELVRQLRTHFGDWTNVHTHIWIMIAEGLINWFGDLSPKALDRMTRAQVLSVATKYEAGIAISSAWKAHIEFDMSDYDSMFRSLRLAKSAASDQDHDANARIGIVICNALLCCGERNAAQDWFARGHRHAVAEGDQAGIEALQYNRAAFTITWLRSECFASGPEPASVRAVRREFESARNYSKLTGISTFLNHLELCDARLTALEGKYALAADMLRSVRGKAPFATYHFSNHLVDLEVAYCLFKSGDCAAALKIANGIDVSEFFDLDTDDRFVAVSMLSEMSESDSGFGDPRALSSSRNDLKMAYESSRRSLREGVQNLLLQIGDLELTRY